MSGDEKNTKLISLWLGREKNIDNLYALQIETNWTNGNFVVADELQQQQHQKKWHKLNGARVSVRETETVQMCVDNANGDVFFYCPTQQKSAAVATVTHRTEWEKQQIVALFRLAKWKEKKFILGKL